MQSPWKSPVEALIFIKVATCIFTRYMSFFTGVFQVFCLLFCGYIFWGIFSRGCFLRQDAGKLLFNMVFGIFFVALEYSYNYIFYYDILSALLGFMGGISNSIFMALLKLFVSGLDITLFIRFHYMSDDG